MKKIIIGVSSFILGQNAYAGSNTYRNFINVSEPKEIILNNSKEITITKENIFKATDFFNKIKVNNAFETNLIDFELKKITITKDEDGKFFIHYEAENDFKSVILDFPISYSNNMVNEIYTIHYSAATESVISGKIEFQNKNIKREIFDKVFLSKKTITLNTNADTDIIYYILAESESKVAYEKIGNMFDNNGVIKDYYKDKNIELILLPSNYYSEKFAIEISALVSNITVEGKSKELFIEYIKNRNSLMDDIKSKYFKKFKDGYAVDFILDMYTETSKAMEALSRELITESVSNMKNSQEKDIITLLKEEQEYIENIIKKDILINREISIFKVYDDSRYYYTANDSLDR
jgi:hypothetical protein